MRSNDVIAVRVAHELEKEALIDMDPAVFFTEPHYNGMLEKILSRSIGSRRTRTSG